MKKTVLLFLFPSLIAISLLFVFIRPINRLAFGEAAHIADKDPLNFKTNFVRNPDSERNFLVRDSVIYLLGSSELTSKKLADIPYHFISWRFPTKVIAIGHAGNQSFSLFFQLLANEKYLPDAPVVLMISPSWFIKPYSEGTSYPVFLEFNSDDFIGRVLSDARDSEFRDYAIERYALYNGELLNPGLNTKAILHANSAKKSIFHQPVYSLLSSMDIFLNDQKRKIILGENTPTLRKQRSTLPAAAIAIDWEKLLQKARADHLTASNNNKWYIENDYYTEYVKERVAVELVADKDNQELKDFVMLVKLLKARKVNASFVVMPLNPFFYKDLEKMDPLMAKVNGEITKSGYPVLNLWNSDPATFDVGVLRDVMHLGNYGWLKADRFIIQTYQLQK